MGLLNHQHDEDYSHCSRPGCRCLSRRGGGRHHGGRCADGSRPTCSDGSAPVFDGDRSTPPCPDGNKPSTCADGSTPSGGRGGRFGRRRCPKTDRVCCDGSTPVYDGDRSTPPCADGSKPRCSQDECNNNNNNAGEFPVTINIRDN